MAKKKSSQKVIGTQPKDLDQAKKVITALEKEIAALRDTYTRELVILIEEAYTAGYSDAAFDFDKKAKAMEKYLQMSLKEFEKNYQINRLKELSPKKAKHKKSKK